MPADRNYRGDGDNQPNTGYFARNRYSNADSSFRPDRDRGYGGANLPNRRERRQEEFRNGGGDLASAIRLLQSGSVRMVGDSYVIPNPNAKRDAEIAKWESKSVAEIAESIEKLEEAMKEWEKDGKAMTFSLDAQRAALEIAETREYATFDRAEQDRPPQLRTPAEKKQKKAEVSRPSSAQSQPNSGKRKWDEDSEEFNSSIVRDDNEETDSVHLLSENEEWNYSCPCYKRWAEQLRASNAMIPSPTSGYQKERLNRKLSREQEESAKKWFDGWLIDLRTQLRREKRTEDLSILTNLPVFVMYHMQGRQFGNGGEFRLMELPAGAGDRGLGDYKMLFRAQANVYEEYETLWEEVQEADRRAAEQASSLKNATTAQTSGSQPKKDEMPVIPTVDLSRMIVEGIRTGESESQYARRQAKFHHIVRYLEKGLKESHGGVDWTPYYPGIQWRIDELVAAKLSEGTFWKDVENVYDRDNNDQPNLSVMTVAEFNSLKDRPEEETVGDWRDFEQKWEESIQRAGEKLNATTRAAVAGKPKTTGSKVKSG